MNVHNNFYKYLWLFTKVKNHIFILINLYHNFKNVSGYFYFLFLLTHLKLLVFFVEENCFQVAEQKMHNDLETAAK